MVFAHRGMGPGGWRKRLKEVGKFLQRSELPMSSRVNGEVDRHYGRKVGQAALVSYETGDDDNHLYRQVEGGVTGSSRERAGSGLHLSSNGGRVREAG